MLNKLPQEIQDLIFEYTDLNTCVINKKFYVADKFCKRMYYFNDVNINILKVIKYLHLNHPKYLIDLDRYAMNACILNNNLDVVKYLYSIDLLNPGFALEPASSYGRLEIIKFLYQKLDLNDCNNTCYLSKALKYSLQGNYIEVVDFLKTKGVVRNLL